MASRARPAGGSRRRPGAPAAAGLIAKDGNGFLVSAILEPDLPDAEQDSSLTAAQARLDRIGLPRSSNWFPGATGQVGGGTLLFDAITGQVEKDLVAGELIALPVSLLVMVLVFGGFLAAGMPIVGAIASIGGGLASLLGFSYLIDLDAAVVNVVTVLGLGSVHRLRAADRLPVPGGTPRAVGGDHHQVHPQPPGPTRWSATMTTAGRTVLFSGVTVAISLSGLLVFEARILRAVGAAGVSVVVVALLVALTLVPALLALAGARMIKPGLLSRIPGLRRLTARFGDVAPDEGFFSRLARWTQRRPWLVVGGVLLILGILAAPALRMELRSSGAQLLPPTRARPAVLRHPRRGVPGVRASRPSRSSGRRHRSR